MWLCCRVLEQRHPAFVQWYRKQCSIFTPSCMPTHATIKGTLLVLLKFLY
uniref:Uncharacterized protein n=1 Tax=Anguilla anguilla TaxID=7936 RepID=A0A0E9VZE6_ANGAN